MGLPETRTLSPGLDSLSPAREAKLHVLHLWVEWHEGAPLSPGVTPLSPAYWAKPSWVPSLLAWEGR